MLTRIDSAVASPADYPTQKTSDELKSLAKAIDHNVVMTIFQIRKNIAITKMMTGNGDIIILDGVYEMKAGKFTFFLIEPMARLGKPL